MEDESAIIEMMDDDGNVLEFEHLLTFEVDDLYYIAFTPAEDMDDYKVGEVLIMQIGEEEDGQEVYLPIESEDELNELWTIFQELYYEEEDVEAEPDGDDEDDEDDEDEVELVEVPEDEEDSEGK